MKKWSEIAAVDYLYKQGAEIGYKHILTKEGLKGLTACSALSFLSGLGYSYINIKCIK